jgi:hypothetical protein
VIDTKPFPVILIRWVPLKQYWGTAKGLQCSEDRVSIPVYIFTLKIEEARSFETLVTTYQTTQHYISLQGEP